MDREWRRSSFRLQRGKLEALDDASLARRARRGDAAAWNVLIRRHRCTLLEAAARWPVARWLDPEDVVQEALTRAWLSRSSLRVDRGGFLPWALTIARRAGLAAHNTESRRQALLERTVPHGDEIPGLAEGGRPPIRPDDVLVSRRTAAWQRTVTTRAMRVLTALERAVILHDADGGKAAEFRRPDGSPYEPVNYRQTLSRARRKLKAWGQNCPRGPP